MNEVLRRIVAMTIRAFASARLGVIIVTLRSDGQDRTRLPGLVDSYIHDRRYNTD